VVGSETAEVDLKLDACADWRAAPRACGRHYREMLEISDESRWTFAFLCSPRWRGDFKGYVDRAEVLAAASKTNGEGGVAGIASGQIHTLSASAP
jgi:hypothetical protein